MGGRVAIGVALIGLAGACCGAELVSRAYPPLLSAGGSGDSFTPLVSEDGQYVVFVSAAENLATNDGNQFHDLFLRDRENFTTTLLSTNEAGVSSRIGHAGGPAVSSNFSLIAYEETQFGGQPLFGSPVLRVTNTAAFLLNHSSGQRRSIGIADGVLLPRISDDPPHTNWITFALPTVTGLQVTADGHRVIFGTPGSYAGFPPVVARSQLLFELDLDSGITNRFWTVVSPATVPNAEIQGVRLSADGERAAFFSAADNLHPLDGWQNGGQFDIYVYDRTASSNILASISADGTRGGSGNSESPDISGDGRLVVFVSSATNLHSGDTHPNADIFLRDLAAGTTLLVSSNLAGVTAALSGHSGASAISRDGRWVAFFSNAGDLVASDSNGTAGDVFLRDNQSGVVTRISNHSDWHGRLAASAQPPQLTPDGSFVLYQAPGSGLFLYERASKVNRRLTADVTADSPSMSSDGRFVAFSSQSIPGLIGGTDAHRQVYLFDRELNSFELISERATGIPVVAANDASRIETGVVATADDLLLVRSYATDLGLRADDRKLRLWNLASSSVPLAIDLGKIGSTPIEVAKAVNLTASANGRWLAFDYDEPALAESQTNSGWHVVLHDRQTGVNRVLNRTTVEFDGPHFPAIAPDGSRVVWRPSASGLDQYDVSSRVWTHLIANSGIIGAEEAPLFTPDNLTLLFRYRGDAIPGFTDQPVPNWRLFRLDPPGSSFAQIDPLPLHSGAGEVATVSLSNNGRHVVFETRNPGAEPAVYANSLAANANTLISGNGSNPRVADGGSAVAFEAKPPSSGLPQPANSRDVLLRYVSSQETSVVSINRSGTAAGNGRSKLLGISPDGRFVLFHSWASDLVADDTNQLGDLFLRDQRTQTTLLLTAGLNHAIADGNTSARALFNRAGTKVCFESYARNLAAGDRNEMRDVFTATLNQPDSDDDGMSDSWELTWFGTLSNGGADDTDGDGVLDRDEFVSGTSPTNDHSVLEVLTIQAGFSAARIILWAAVPGRTYRVQFKDDFNHPGWTDLPNDLVADSSTGRKYDAGTAGAQRFYRVLILP